MKWLLFVIGFGMCSSGCGGGESADGCNVNGDWKLKIKLGNGDCLPEVTTTSTINVKRSGDSVTVTDDDGDSPDVDLFDADLCEIGLLDAFYAPETADSYEVVGILSMGLAFDGDTAAGDGYLTAAVNVDGTEEECSQDFTVTGNRN